MVFPGEDLCPKEYWQFFNDMHTRVMLITIFAFKGLETAPVVDGGTSYLAASMIHKETSFPFLLNVTTMDMADCIIERNYNKFLEKVRSVYDSLCYKTGAVTDAVDVGTPLQNVMPELLDGFHDCFKEKVLFMMDKEGIHDMKLLVGNVAYSKTFCDKVSEFGSVASKILFDRLMTTPKRHIKKRPLELLKEPLESKTESKTGSKTDKKTKKIDTTKTLTSVDLSDVMFYTPRQIMHFRHNPERLVNKFRIIGYDEEGNVNDSAPFVCIQPSGGNSATFMATKSKSVLRVPGIYNFAHFNSTPSEYVAEKFHSIRTFKESL